jgi:para-aminobenzoate synthetase / 4-amino-4-deoxychorismate lyase
VSFVRDGWKERHMESSELEIGAALQAGRYAILDNNRTTEGGTSYIFHDPITFCSASSADEVAPALAQVEQYIQAGYCAVGYFSYELGYLFSSRLKQILPSKRTVPLLCVGIYGNPIEVADGTFAAALAAHASEQEAHVLNCRLNMTKPEYLEVLGKAMKHIVDGDTYQINYTLKYKFRYVGSPLKLYAELRKRQRVAYGACLDFPGLTVLSRSPELFIEKLAESMHTRPMKGTSMRGQTHEQDRRNAEFLSSDTKSRAENVMIVDLLRNDLSRISQRGTVRTAELFKVETYETLHQMVSTVSARVDQNIPLDRVLSQLFPCGSVTGAPKVRTMEIIEDLEREPRGIYTGAIGFARPNRAMCFNVAIRTLALWPDGTGEMGVGSGIVYDSDAEAEYEECRLKGRFLTATASEFHLIECVLFDGVRYRALEEHLARMARSAEALGFDLDREQLQSSLADVARALKSPTKVRILLNRNGHRNVECVGIAEATGPEKWIALSPNCTRSTSWFLQHKTSVRTLYDRMYDRYSRRGYYDVVFTNENGEITEGTFNNVFIRRGNRWYTPPVSCGLLPGIQRQSLLRSKEIDAVERVLSIDDLVEADELVLTNSIRGVVKTRFDATGREASCCA